MTFEEIVDVMVKSCNKHFYKGVYYEGLPRTIIECATKIYLEQNKNKENK